MFDSIGFLVCLIASIDPTQYLFHMILSLALWQEDWYIRSYDFWSFELEVAGEVSANPLDEQLGMFHRGMKDTGIAIKQ